MLENNPGIHILCCRWSFLSYLTNLVATPLGNRDAGLAHRLRSELLTAPVGDVLLKSSELKGGHARIRFPRAEMCAPKSWDAEVAVSSLVFDLHQL